MSPKVRSLFL
jgi:hypothetical protein